MDTAKVATLSVLSAVAGAVAAVWALEHDVVHKAKGVLGLQLQLDVPVTDVPVTDVPQAKLPVPVPDVSQAKLPVTEADVSQATEASQAPCVHFPALSVHLDGADEDLATALQRRGIRAIVPDGSNCSMGSVQGGHHAVVRREGRMGPHTCAAYVALHSMRDAAALPIPVALLLPVHSEQPRAGMPYFNTLALLQCPAARDTILTLCAARVRAWHATVIVAYETRALVWASALATMCRLPLVAARREEDTMGMQVVASVVQEPSHRAHARVCVDGYASREDDIVVVFDDVVNSGNTMRALKEILQPMCAQVHDLVLVNCHEPHLGLMPWAEA